MKQPKVHLEVTGPNSTGKETMTPRRSERLDIQRAKHESICKTNGLAGSESARKTKHKKAKKIVKVKMDVKNIVLFTEVGIQADPPTGGNDSEPSGSSEIPQLKKPLVVRKDFSSQVNVLELLGTTVPPPESAVHAEQVQELDKEKNNSIVVVDDANVPETRDVGVNAVALVRKLKVEPEDLQEYRPAHELSEIHNGNSSANTSTTSDFGHVLPSVAANPTSPYNYGFAPMPYPLTPWMPSPFFPPWMGPPSPFGMSPQMFHPQMNYGQAPMITLPRENMSMFNYGNHLPQEAPRNFPENVLPLCTQMGPPFVFPPLPPISTPGGFPIMFPSQNMAPPPDFLPAFRNQAEE